MKEKVKILVVDDDPDIQDAIRAVLEAQSYEVISAEDGEKALEKIEEVRPTLMILDLLMPKKDGFAVCKELKEPKWAKYADMPILILTSVREEASRRRYELETGTALDVDDYVEKPVTPAKLLSRIEKLIKKKLEV